MALQETSLAPVVGVAPKNVQFVATAQNLPRKILVVGTYDETTFTEVVENTPTLAPSPEDVGSKTGFGFMLHRLVKAAFAGANGVPIYWVAQPEDVAAVVADGSIRVTTSTTFTESGAIYLYIAGIRYVIPVASGEDGDDWATLAVAIINADKETPVVAAVDGVNTDQVNLTAKSKGLWGNDIDIDINLNFGEASPLGTTTVTIVPMASGTTVGNIQDALDALGTGDEKNRDHYTELSHGYGQDTGTLDDLSTYNGVGNDFVGLYAKTVARPFRSLNGDISSSLSVLLALGATRKLDRTNGIIATPGSPNHPAEVAALATGYMASINNNRAAQSYIGQVLAGVLPPVTSQWTATYDSRDAAVRAGISPTVVESGVVQMSSVLTFYHPDSVPVTSNGYRSMRNISILQNILWNIKLNFQQEKWKGVSIVDDVVNVTNSNDRKKARDVGAVIDDLLALVRAFHAKAWIFSSDFTIAKIQAGGLVVIRPGGIGFNSTLPILLSGEAGIFDTEVEFDTALDIVLAA
jgi:phage tail sheath gpL-like